MKRSSIFFLCLLVFIFTTTQINCRGINQRKNQPKISHRRRLSSKFDDLEKLAGNFVATESKRIKRDVLWWDIHGKNPHLQKRQYKDFKLSVQTNDIVFGKSKYRPAEVKNPVPQVLENRGNFPKEEEATCEYSSAVSYRWFVTQGMSTKSPTKVDVIVSPRLGVDIEYRDSVDLQMTRPRVRYPRQDSYKSVFKVPLPPRTAVSVQCYVVGHIISTPWASRLDIEGWIAVWYTKKYLNHHLWFYRITELNNEKLHRMPDDCSLAYISRGTFSAFTGTESRHTFTQYWINPDGTYNHKPVGEEDELLVEGPAEVEKEEEEGDEEEEEEDEDEDEDDDDDDEEGEEYTEIKGGPDDETSGVTDPAAVIEKPCDDAYEAPKTDHKKAMHPVIGNEQFVVDLVPDDLPTEKVTF